MCLEHGKGAKIPVRKGKIELKFPPTNHNYDLTMIDSIDCIENTSDEARIRERWYFGRGMFVATSDLITGSGVHALPSGCEEIVVISYLRRFIGCSHI